MLGSVERLEPEQSLDNLTHTLVGAALAESGLKRRTALGTATLLIGANLPDVDVLSYMRGSVFALSVRRGITHGLMALVVLPFVLTGLMLAWDRLWPHRQRAIPPASARQLLLLSAIAIATHPVLDFLNSYGMRWLMPFSGKWIYGDTLFIIDPWVWAILTAGIVIARRRGGFGPAAAQTSLAIVVAYVSLMAGVGGIGRVIARRSLVEQGIGAPDRLMVAPFPVTPLRKQVVAEVNGVYVIGTMRYLPPSLTLEQVRVPRYRGPVATDLQGDRDVRRFLSWARFPFTYVEGHDAGHVVELGDARYTLDPRGSWAGIVVDVRR